MIYMRALNLVLGFIFCVNIASSQAGYVIDQRVINVSISETGVVTFEEQINVDFLERRRGIFRSIPYRYNVNGKDVKVHIKNLRAENHKFKVTDSRGQKTIRIGDANIYLEGKENYVVKYEVSNAIVDYGDHAEFYWNLVDFQTDTETTKSSFTITFPKPWTDSITDYRAYTGLAGSKTADIVIHQTENALIGAHRTPLSPNQGITIAVKIPKSLIPANAISIPESSDQNGNREDSKFAWVTSWWNLLPIGLSGFLLFLWQKFERKEQFQEPIPTFVPPDGMSPAEVGTFYDHRVNKRDIISLLPYWGNHGLLTIKPIEGGDNDMYFTKIKDIPGDFPEYQIYLFQELFDKSDIVLLSDFKDQFYTTVAKTSSKLKKAVYQEELFDQQSVKVFHSGWMLLLSFVSIGIGIFLIVKFTAVMAAVGLFIIAIFLFVIHFLKPKLSAEGRRLKNELRGLHAFLKNPDDTKMKELIDDDPDYIHMIYPYVLAFDLDRSWSAYQSENLSYGPPIWYASGYPHGRDHTFRYRDVSDHIDVRQIEKVFYSAPAPAPSSGGGGFSGGSAGGGFGGGSTGSW